MEMGVMEAPGPERFVQVRIWGQKSPYEIVLGNFDLGRLNPHRPATLQFGINPPTGYTLARAYCVLEKVGDTYFGKGISEKNSSQRLCTDGDVTHVHIQN